MVVLIQVFYSNNKKYYENIMKIYDILINIIKYLKSIISNVYKIEKYNPFLLAI